MRRLQRRHSPRAFTPHKRRIDLPTSAGDCQVTQIATRSYASQVPTFSSPPPPSNANYDAQSRFTIACIDLPTSADVRQTSPITTRSHSSQAPNLSPHQRRRLPSNANCDAQLRLTSAKIHWLTNAKQHQLRRAVTLQKRVHLPSHQRQRPPSNASHDAQLRLTHAEFCFPPAPTTAKLRHLRGALTTNKGHNLPTDQR